MFKNKKSYLEFTLYNFGIGMGVYVFYAYCVILLLPFSIYTILFPIIIFNVACFIKFRKDGDYIEPFQKKTISEHISTNKDFILKRFICLAIIFATLFYRIYPVVFFNSSLLSSDPYVWGAKVYGLLKYGNLDYDMVGAYFASVTVICAYYSIFSVDGIIIFAFCKFLPVVFLFISLLFVVCIIDRIIGLISWSPLFLPFILLLQGLFFCRALILLPTMVTNLFVGVLLLSLLFDRVPLFMVSLFMANIIISHPFNGPVFSILFFGILIIYYFFKFDSKRDAKNVVENMMEQSKEDEGGYKTNTTDTTKTIRIKYVKDPLFLEGLSFKTKILRVIIMISIAVIIVLPSIVHMTVYYRMNWISNYLHYLRPSPSYSSVVKFIGNNILKQEDYEPNIFSYYIHTPTTSFPTGDLMFSFTIFALVIPTKSAIGTKQKTFMLLLKIFTLIIGLTLISYNIIFPYILPEESLLYKVIYKSSISSYHRRLYEIVFFPYTVLFVSGIVYLTQFIQNSINDYRARKIKVKANKDEDHGWKALAKKNVFVALFLAFFIIRPINLTDIIIIYEEPGAYESFTVCYGIVQDSETRLNVGYSYSVRLHVDYMNRDANFIKIDQPFDNNLTVLRAYLELNQIDYLWLFFNNTAQSTDPDCLLVIQNIDSIGKVLYNDTNYYVIEVF